MQNKNWIHFFFLIITTLIFTGCSSVPTITISQPEQGETLIIWAWDENYNILAVKKVIQVNKESNPDINIEVVSMTQEESVAKLNSAFATNAVENFPDIVLIEDYRIQSLLGEYSQYFVSLDDIVSSSDFVEYKTITNQKEGKLYGIPFDSGVVGLFYRLDYIEEAGYSQEDKIIDEFYNS